VYESELRLRVVTKGELDGTFVNLTRTTHGVIPMKAYAGGAPRFFIRSKVPSATVAGRWSVVFNQGQPDSTYAIGVFEQDGGLVKGTFLTAAGDYRYLEGVVDGDSLFLSAFDGVFVYLFRARVRKSTIDGVFYSGTHRQVPFAGFRDEGARLPDATSLATYSNGNKPLSFTFPDTDSIFVSLSDERFRNKPVVVQILGSWCPNCLDESVFLQEYYLKNRDRGIEIIGLSFEKTDDFSRAANNIKRFRNRLNITYPLLIAASRERLKATLPGLDGYLAFPTTIYLDRNHRVRKIYTGFSGQATGVEYEKFKDDFSLFMEKLLSE
jgi:peroxiredoxin